jgi:hypothetical protein
MHLPISSRGAFWVLLTTANAWLPLVRGFPAATGSCAAGTEALLQTTSLVGAVQIHGSLNQVGGTALSDFNLTLTLDGEVLDPSVPVDFATGVDHELSLQADSVDNAFAGFLIRMQNSDSFTPTVDSILPALVEQPDGNFTSKGVQVSQICRSVNLVGGVTHDTPKLKTIANMILNMDFETQALELDVTVVIKTNEVLNISSWYYSRYILNSVIVEEATTPPEITPVPSEGPTAAPTSAPTEAKNGGGMLTIHIGLWLTTLGTLWML